MPINEFNIGPRSSLSDQNGNHGENTLTSNGQERNMVRGGLQTISKTDVQYFVLIFL